MVREKTSFPYRGTSIRKRLMTFLYPEDNEWFISLVSMGEGTRQEQML